MKNVLKLSLAAVAIAALSACGGGDSTDVTDVYVGTWKSACYAGTSSTGQAFYTKRIRTLSKVSATELAGSTILDSPFSDAGCKNVAGTWNSNAASNTKYVLGAKANFLGANTDSYVATFSDNTQSAGFSVVNNSTQLYLVEYAIGAAIPTGWSSTSPYTKQ